MVSIYDMDKFKQKEMKKITPIKNAWYDWLYNYIPKYRWFQRWNYKSFLRQTHLKKLCIGEETNYGNQKHKTLENLLYQKRTKKIKDRIIRDILTLFEERKK